MTKLNDTHYMPGGQQYRADNPLLQLTVGMMVTISDLTTALKLPIERVAAIVARNTKEAAEQEGDMSESLVDVLKMVTHESHIVMDRIDAKRAKVNEAVRKIMTTVAENRPSGIVPC